MTKQKHLKDRIRQRMQKTGERYVTARRHILAQATRPVSSGPERFHLPGNVPATTALRILLAAAEVHPKNHVEELSEAMLFGIAGGIGAGVFAFRYEQEDFSSFFVAGRHLWQDDVAYLEMACRRLGVDFEIQETSGSKTAEKQLREALGSEMPVVAWVDMALLPRRASPPGMEGGQYHLITVYSIDDDTSQASIGDLYDQPYAISLDALSQARQRIRKQKNRLLRFSKKSGNFELDRAVLDGIAACHSTLVGRGAVKNPGGKSMASNFTLDAYQKWAERMHGSSDKQSWAKMFPRGVHLWRGLTSVYSFIHFGTGGGLSRPLYAQFFNEAHQALGAPALQELSEHYEQLGSGWDDLAEAALPDDVEAFRRFKDLSVEKAELMLSGGDRAVDRISDIWRELSELEQAAADHFPLDERQSDALRATLKERVLELHQRESAAHQLLGQLVDQGF